MIKKIVLAVTACLLIFLTYSCTKIDYGVNLPKEYKEFFDHTFGWYKVELIDKTIASILAICFGSIWTFESPIFLAPGINFNKFSILFFSYLISYKINKIKTNTES